MTVEEVAERDHRPQESGVLQDVRHQDPPKEEPGDGYHLFDESIHYNNDLQPSANKLWQSSTLQEGVYVPTAAIYADGKLSGPSA